MRKKKGELRKVQDSIWELCKNITRERYGPWCYTCGRGPLEGSSWQTGHMWAKGALGASLKYDLRILRPQCYNCNINNGGMGAVFYRNMAAKEGKKYMTQLELDLIQDRRGLIKASTFYPILLEKYQKIWKKLNKNSFK